LVASVRNLTHLLRAAEIGAHVATVPFSVLRQILHHPLTDKGLDAFLADWRKTSQKI
jgi:transaldolase